jgi:hypothetical protein
MLTYEKLARRPTHFLRFAGLTVEQFDPVLSVLAPRVEVARRERLSRSSRQRALGGGGKYRLALADRLLMTLCYHRLYLTQTLLGYLFDLDGSNVCRNLQEITPLLRDVLPTPERVLSKTLATMKRIGSPEELFEKFPDLKLIVDATEQPVQRPKDKTKRNAHYSGRRKRPTKKRQVIVTSSGLILDQSPSVPGRVHDWKLFQSHYDGMPRLGPLFESVVTYVDSGYQGIEPFLPRCRIRIIQRARRNRPLREKEKRRNSLRSSHRIRVEHAISRIKKYRIAADIYRGGDRTYDTHMGVVAGLANLRRADALGITV